MLWAHATLYTLSAILLLGEGGNLICRRLLERITPAIKASPQNKIFSAGRIIGWLERILVAVGIILQSWEVLAAVIALKSVARFNDLDKQEFAEYFLVGSLFSLLWAIAITCAWIGYDQTFGIDLHASIAKMVRTSDGAE
ncbi:MAG: hypothetical protein INR68_03490 [Methylobacterium mesophilicum]|nr:hypothetical protein [Methylobacterium mesophilicum]